MPAPERPGDRGSRGIQSKGYRTGLALLLACTVSAQVYEGEQDLQHSDARAQGMRNFGPDWSGDAHLLWNGAVGDRLTVYFEVRTAGDYSLDLQLTTAPDYGIFQVTLDGKPIGQAIGLYTQKVALAPLLALGSRSLDEGQHRMDFQLVGANVQARPFKGKGYLIGIDYLRLKWVGDAAPVAPIQPIDFARAQSLFAEYCFRCHGEKGKKVKGKVNLKAIPHKQGFLADIELTQALVDALSAKEMPPEDEEQLADSERIQLERLFSGYLREYLAANTRVEPVVMRRLNRYEYNHAVVDLLKLHKDIYPLPEKVIRAYRAYFNPATGRFPTSMDIGNRAIGKKQMEPPILQGVLPFAVDLQAEHGFNNRGDQLSVSPILLEHFLQLSQRIVNSPQFQGNCASYASLFMPEKGRDALETAKARIPALLRRAFRAPVDPETIDRYLGLFAAQRATGQSFETSMKKVVSAVLSSPYFLYQIERKSGAKAVEALDGFELASRLSFFLWSRIPDDELLDLAARGVLHQPDILQSQVTRMLQDPRAKALSENFARQWLQLDRLISAQPDIERFVTFYSRMGCEYWGMGSHMMLEPLLVFERIQVENRSLLELVDSPYTYRPDSLHTWYNDPQPFAGKHEKHRFNVYKETFKLRELDDRRQGGAIFTAASMTMTSSPLRTLPITRGAWVATVVFNDPPDPPPDDVPDIEADDQAIAALGLTVRERLEQHRDLARCRSCHQKIDPLGFALESYDAVGRWRDTYHGGKAVDASGILFGNHPVKDIVAFKDALLSEPQRFVRPFSEHMLSYALGRDLAVSDTPALERIVATVLDRDLRFNALVHAITTSIPFQHKTNQVE
jgi:mono/diheme cytochrome c family protein